MEVSGQLNVSAGLGAVKSKKKLLQVIAKFKLHLCLPNYAGLKTLRHHEIFQNVIL
jgi:hypothetical protein